MKTQQEIFDHTLQHLRKQGVRSGKPSILSDTFLCQYRGPDNTSCAIGCHIPDEAYAAAAAHGVKLEGLNARHLPTSLLVASGLQDPDTHPGIMHYELLISLQNAHDGRMPLNKGASLQSWEAAMRHIAETYKLNYTEPT
jgi:hypothetical protein